MWLTYLTKTNKGGELKIMYDLGLTESQKLHARKLHVDNIVIDMLFQGPIGTYALPEGLEKELLDLVKERHPYDEVAQVELASKYIRQWYTNGKLSNLYKECWYESGITAACRQLSLKDKDTLMQSMARIQAEFDYKPWLKKVRTAAEIEAAHQGGYKAGLVTSQETLGYGKDLALFELAHEFGLRVQQLTYNNHNLIGAGCMEPNDAGLSRFGLQFVAKANELGVIVDIAHSGRQTTLDACKYSLAPVVATHTGANQIFCHERCKSDAELKAIADTGGVIGIFAMPWFIAKDPANTTINHLVDHIDYVANLVGVDHVGIGTDWPMPQTKWMALAFKKHVAPSIGFAPGDGPSTEYVHGLKDYRSFGNITAALVARGYADEEIIKIIGGNWLRVLHQVCR